MRVREALRGRESWCLVLTCRFLLPPIIIWVLTTRYAQKTTRPSARRFSWQRRRRQNADEGEAAEEGEDFDANSHMALFNVPIPEGSDAKAGTVAAVTKTGYSLHERVIRAAEVGVYQ